MSDHKTAVQRSVEERRSELLELSHAVHADAETAFKENISSQRLVQHLTENGFSVDSPIAGLDTAFRASFGTGELNIAICAEYDALKGVGHACGHNVIAAAALGAALALAPLADELGITVTVLGTPAEEGGGGKVLMLQEGAFDGVCAAMMVHPAAVERDAMATLAVSEFDVHFFGKASHAAAAPQRGVSASAALTLVQNGIALLREHLEAEDRVHGIVVRGGDAANVVPHHTSGMWFVRSATIDRKNELAARVMDIFRGAALMTGCTFSARQMAPTYSDLRTDAGIAAAWRANAGALGRDSQPLSAADGPASTDMGNVSYAVPTIHPLLALDSDGANIHEAAFEKFAAQETGDKAVLDGAKAMAMTVIDVATDEAVRQRLIDSRYSVANEPVDAPYLDRDWQRTVEYNLSAPTG